MRRTAGIIIIIAVVAIAIVLAVKPRQERITPLQAASSNAHDANYLGMIARNMVSGGPDKDGIPAIDNPTYVTAGEADTFLTAQDNVFGVVIDGAARAYPQKILYWHEVVNEEVNRKAFSITYCPLTGSVIGYAGKNLGVSGKLYNSNLVLYDRATGSEIPQMLGIAVNGPEAGAAFERFPVTVTTWAQWKREHPNTMVLSENTGFRRDYDRNPYPGYDALLRVWFPVAAESTLFPSKKWVTGIEHNNEYLAVPKEEFTRVGTATAMLGGEEIIITYNTSLGAIVAQASNGSRVLSFDAHWFAWYAYHPDTRVFGG